LITINDIANKAGVSPATVSRILNNKNKYSNSKALRVLDIARELGYSVRKQQKRPATATKTIGVAVPTYLTNFFYFNVYESIYITADELGYAIRLRKMNYLHENQTNDDLIKAFDGTVDGIIFVGHFTITQNDIQSFIDKNVPMVFLLNNMDSEGVINVLCDAYTGAYDATQYLIDMGHRKIAHIMGHPKNKSSIEKMNGYINALEDNGINFDPSLVRVGNFSYEETYHCSIELLNDYPDITALFCCTDEMASAFIKAANEKGFKIPDDISVIGFDDIRPENLLGQSVPLLTTVNQPRREMAKYAVYCLYNRIHGIDIPVVKKFKTNLVIRNSVKRI